MCTLGEVSACAFRRISDAEPTWPARNVPVSRWLRDGERHTVRLEPLSSHRVRIPRGGPAAPALLSAVPGPPVATGASAVPSPVAAIIAPLV